MLLSFVVKSPISKRLWYDPFFGIARVLSIQRPFFKIRGQGKCRSGGFYSENVISSSEGTVDPIDIVGYKFDRAKGLHFFIVRTARIRGKD